MHFFFNSRKKTPVVDAAGMEHTLAGLIEKGYRFVQSTWAQWMTRQTAKISPTNLLVLWVFFISVCAAYSTYLIVQSLSGAATPGIPVPPMVMPMEIPPASQEGIEVSRSVSKNKIENSMRLRPPGDRIFSSPTKKR